MLGDIFVRILEMSGKGSLVILGVLLARLALKRAPKIFSYLLWGVVLLRLLCPFTLEAPVSILPRTDSPRNTPWRTSPSPRQGRE